MSLQVPQSPGSSLSGEAIAAVPRATLLQGLVT